MDAEVRGLYAALLDRWNARDAAGMAALFAPYGHVIGFDGSEMSGPAAIQASLSAIFAHHQTGRYVSKVRSVRGLGDDAVLLVGVAGMIPPGQTAINPGLNAVQTVVAVRRGEGLQIELFQNTPAAYHGRPDAVTRLTEELTSQTPAE